ncbi:hypothetical protein [Taibaiella soli]|uniref:Class I SAM-dependent methyltransferase n=1 Tax=Taibaiella soli TaxID=1649169 RepID=A0A2W2AMX8_9BACT|nr:hypothetical protein [Taibaiella soli]PZF74902.1 hypothetical protein DN068_01520 [Taibaiella soli]
MENKNRDYSTISPSAKALILMKGLTNIPYAKETATLISLPEKYVQDYSSREMFYWARVLHFEYRYWSIDQLLADIPHKNILELSSGFSFRGLAVIQKEEVHYIDTDLPNIIEAKEHFTETLKGNNFQAKGTLEILPLNALDEEGVRDTTNHFPPGEIVIVNEGLLMYLGMPEKEKLCSIIRKILQERGGYWITADIYIKNEYSNDRTGMTDELNQFFQQHNIAENMFDSFEAAESFFNQNGFTLDKEAEMNYQDMTVMPYLLQSATPERMEMAKKQGRIHATWRLKLATPNP